MPCCTVDAFAEVNIIGASLSEPHMNVKSGARMCNMYVCMCVYLVRRVARACHAVRDSHVGAHVVVTRTYVRCSDCRLDYQG